MNYREVKPISRVEAEKLLKSQDADKVCDALLRLAYYDPDWRMVQNLCLEFVQSHDVKIRSLSVTCLGHLARMHGNLDVDQVILALNALHNDFEVQGRVKDALDDINLFIR